MNLCSGTLSTSIRTPSILMCICRFDLQCPSKIIFVLFKFSDSLFQPNQKIFGIIGKQHQFQLYVLNSRETEQHSLMGVVGSHKSVYVFLHPTTIWKRWHTVLNQHKNRIGSSEDEWMLKIKETSEEISPWIEKHCPSSLVFEHTIGTPLGLKLIFISLVSSAFLHICSKSY